MYDYCLSGFFYTLILRDDCQQEYIVTCTICVYMQNLTT